MAHLAHSHRGSCPPRHGVDLHRLAQRGSRRWLARRPRDVPLPPLTSAPLLTNHAGLLLAANTALIVVSAGFIIARPGILTPHILLGGSLAAWGATLAALAGLFIYAGNRLRPAL